MRSVTSREEWDAEFSSRSSNHRGQNLTIMMDALGVLPPDTFDVRTIMDFGCGTGDGLMRIASLTDAEYMLGVDISPVAITLADEVNDDGRVSFMTYDVSRDAFRCFRSFDVIVSSNVLEHFADPYPLIDGMLSLCGRLVLIVPYRHHEWSARGDEYGTIQHVFEFSEESISRYEVTFEAKFKSEGWKNVTNHDNPMQWAVIIEQQARTVHQR